MADEISCSDTGEDPVIVSGLTAEAQRALSATVDPSGPLEAAFVVRRTGVVLASWARTSVEAEIASVMAATLMGSVETLTEALRCPSPEHVSVETEAFRMLAAKVEPQSLLVVVARCGVGRDVLQREARRILPGVSEALLGDGTGGRLSRRPTIVPARTPSRRPPRRAQ